MIPTLFGPKAERTAGPRSRSAAPAADQFRERPFRAFERAAGQRRRHDLDRRHPRHAGAGGRSFQERIGGGRIRSERRLRKVELFGRHCAEESFDSLSVDFDVVVEKQDRLVAQEQIRPQLHEATNGGCFGSGLNNSNVGLRMDVALVVVVEENVISTRLFKVGCVKPLAALDEDKNGCAPDEPLRVRYAVGHRHRSDPGALAIPGRLSGGPISLSLSVRSKTRKDASSSDRGFTPRVMSRTNSTSISARGRLPACSPYSRKCRNGWGWLWAQSGFCDTYQPWSNSAEGEGALGSGWAR